MLKAGNIHEIAAQMLKTPLQIIALQEIRWKGSGQIIKDKYSLYYSCSQQHTGQLGTGFMVKRDVMKNV
jgi:exonuclease III